MASDDTASDNGKYGFQRPEMFSTKLAGTLDAYDRHVFLCYKSPEAWPAKVEGSESDPFPKLLSSAFRAHKNDTSVKTKLTVFEGREGTEFADGDVLIFPDMIKYRGLKESGVDSFVYDVIVNGKPWASGAQEVLTGSHVLVCAHGSRDRRCGVCGPVVIDKFIEEAELRGLKDQVFVSPCSHIGGHKYAGNLIIYSPDADGKITDHWYGYVAPDDVPELLDEHIGKGQIILWRGQMGVSAEVAEKSIRARRKDISVKVPNFTSRSCCYKTVTEQPSDCLGVGFKEQFKEFRGTTTMTMLVNGCIQSVADGRLVYPRAAGVETGFAKKLYSLNGTHMGTVAGHFRFAKRQLRNIKKKLCKFSAADIVRRMQKFADHWDDDHSAQIGVHGFNGDEGFLLQVNACGAHEIDDGYAWVCFTGHGTSAALDHCEKLLPTADLETKDDVFNFMKQCVAAAACVSSSTGGRFLEAYLDKGSVVQIKPKREHVILQISKDFDLLQEYFENSFLYITKNMVFWGKQGEDEDDYQKHIRDQYRGVERIQVLGMLIREKKSVRLIKFECPERLREAMAVAKAKVTQMKGGKGPERLREAVTVVEAKVTQMKEGKAESKKRGRNGKEKGSSVEIFLPTKDVFEALSREFRTANSW